MAHKANTIDRTGATAGSTLLGIAPSNQGLRLRVFDTQLRGAWGPVTGSIVVLDAGNNRHTPVLEELLDRVTDAATILTAIRREVPACVGVANTNLLIEMTPALTR
jgi:hypothetical protein